MSQNPQNSQKRKRLPSNIPTQDFFKNPVEIGDVLLINVNSFFQVGKVVSLNIRSIIVTCERGNSKRTIWDSSKQSRVQKDYTPVSNSISWSERLGVEYIEKALKLHNGTKPVYMYRHTFNNANPHIINLTKLNIYHENP